MKYFPLLASVCVPVSQCVNIKHGQNKTIMSSFKVLNPAKPKPLKTPGLPSNKQQPTGGRRRRQGMTRSFFALLEHSSIKGGGELSAFIKTFFFSPVLSGSCRERERGEKEAKTRNDKHVKSYTCGGPHYARSHAA